MKERLLHLARVAASIAGWVGGLYITRWVLGMGKPREDARPLRNLANDARYYWRRRSAIVTRWRVRLQYELGITGHNLLLLRLRYRLGGYADDTC